MIKRLVLVGLLALSTPAYAGVKEDYTPKYGPCIAVEQVDDRHINYIFESNGKRHVIETQDDMIQADTVLLTDAANQESLKPMDTPLGEYMKTHKPTQSSLAEKLPDGTVIIVMEYPNGATVALRIVPDSNKVIAAATIYPKRSRA